MLALQRDLDTGAYSPGAYRLFGIYEKKQRLIAAAPFRDRVVHHALMNVIEAPLDRAFIFDTYACRRGKGVHRAVARYQNWANRYRYALQMDIKKYFPSIDQGRLKAKLADRIKDEKTRGLLDEIIDSYPSVARDTNASPQGERQIVSECKGIPIGNLTSQFFANLYLDDFDHRMKEKLGLKAYLRYVDDLVVLNDDKSRLSEIRRQVQEQLLFDRLRLHPNKAHIVPTHRGIDLLGYRVFPGYRRLLNGNVSRFNRRMHKLGKGFKSGRITLKEIKPHVDAWLGHARQADTEGLRRKVFSGIVFSRESAERPPCVAGRRVE